jgi:uncharacterized membrane protein YcaP (DUF421 family)
VEGLPGLGSSPLDIVIRTLVVYVAVVFGLRIGGKREVGQLGTVDLVALLLLANAVQNAMVGTDSSLAGGLISGLVILLSTRVLDVLTRRSVVIRRLVIGESRVLIQNGHVDRKAMAHEQISDDDLQEALHEHGLEYRREVRRATLEVDGSISIIPMPEAAEHFQAGGGPDSANRRAGRIPRRSAARSQRFSTDVLPPPADEPAPAAEETTT